MQKQSKPLLPHARRARSCGRRGIRFCVLTALAEKDRYGYELVKTLVVVLKLGVTEGTLYPLLSRLRVQGLVRSRREKSCEGPARKYCALTKEGRKAFSMMQRYLDTLNEGTGILLRKGERV